MTHIHTALQKQLTHPPSHYMITSTIDQVPDEDFGLFFRFIFLLNFGEESGSFLVLSLARVFEVISGHLILKVISG